jgi:glutaredoxin
MIRLLVSGVTLTLLALAVPHATQAGQKLYRWVDADGRVHYTDKPPPGTAHAIEKKSLGDAPGTNGLPYAVQRAMKAFPVTLYSSDCGEPCTAGRRLLQQRQIPFTDKDARDPAVQAEMKKLLATEELDVPVLFVGRNAHRGWQQSQWNAALDAAGYPSGVGPR